MKLKTIFALALLLNFTFFACSESKKTDNQKDEETSTEQTSDAENSEKTEETSNNQENSDAYPILIVEDDIYLDADMKSDDYKIFGYESADVKSSKMLLLSTMTADVENNPHACSLGAFYDMDAMNDEGVEFSKYLGEESGFAKFEMLVKDEGSVANPTIYIEKGWVKVK